MVAHYCFLFSCAKIQGISVKRCIKTPNGVSKRQTRCVNSSNRHTSLTNSILVFNKNQEKPKLQFMRSLFLARKRGVFPDDGIT